MNKRENAIWKLVAFLGLFLLVLNIFSTIKSNSKLASSIYGRKCDSGQEDCNEKRGIIDYFYEFEQYPNSITQDNSDMLKIINSYDSVNGDEILSKSKKLPLSKFSDFSGFFTKKYKPIANKTLNNPRYSIKERQPISSTIRARGAAPAKLPNEPTPIIIAARLAKIFGSYILAKIK